MKKIYVAFLLVFGLFSTAIAQITISPTHVFVNSRTHFGSYLVINGGDTPQEVSIDFNFSYTAIDENGNITLVEEDSGTANKFSIAQWVQAFPKNFVLQPGERQTIRLRVAAPNNLPEKMYWARIITTSSALSQEVGTVSTDGVAAQVGIQLKQNIGLYYKVGNVQTGINIKNLETSIDSTGTLWALANINRTGNAPFLGTIYTSVFNENNEKVAQSLVSTTIFFGGLIKRPVNISNLPDGNYTAKIRFIAKRNDIPVQKLPNMKPAVSTTTFTIE